MKHDDILRLTGLDLADKSQQQMWLDALETLGREAEEAINSKDYDKANTMLDTADQIIVFPQQYPPFKVAVQRLEQLWQTICEADKLFTRYNELSGIFAIAVDPTDELNKNTNDNEQ